jgi:predicted PurR-regulated permease PerM
MTGPRTDAPEPRGAARERARLAWAELRDRLATVTPAAIGRLILTVGVAAVVFGVAAATWPTLLPFVVGGLLAYAVLPIVDGLDRFMPRVLAAVLTMLGVLAALVAVIVIVVPPLAQGILTVAGEVPTGDRIDEAVAGALAGLPESTRESIGPAIVDLTARAREALNGASGQVGQLVPTVVRAAVGVVGAVLGLLVLPSWLLVVLSDQRRARTALDREMAGWLRTDAWAIIRLFDRAAGTYLRGFVVIAILTGIVTWIGLTIVPRLGGPTFQGALALATLAGALQVVPAVGPILGLAPALLLLLVDPQRAAAYLIVYITSRVLVGWVVGGRTDVSRVRVHPAFLIPGVVVLSQLGPFWLLLSAPILAFTSDLVRYLHGRLSEPARPAGVLPGEPLPTAAGRGAVPRIPPVYAAHRQGPAPLPSGIRSAGVATSSGTAASGPLPEPAVAR